MVVSFCASAHNFVQSGPGFSQLRSSAGHSSAVLSNSQPGRSVHAAPTQRLRVRVSTGLSPAAEAEEGPGVAAGAFAAGSGGTGAPGGYCRLAQPTSEPRIAAAIHQRPRPGNIVMGLILVEALGALAVLLLIVWW